MSNQNSTAVLLLSCPDRKGLVSGISSFISSHSGNIINLNEHVDTDGKIFFLRVSWDLSDFTIPRHEIGKAIDNLVTDPADLLLAPFLGCQTPGGHLCFEV